MAYTWSNQRFAEFSKVSVAAKTILIYSIYVPTGYTFLDSKLGVWFYSLYNGM